MNQPHPAEGVRNSAALLCGHGAGTDPFALRPVAVARRQKPEMTMTDLPEKTCTIDRLVRHKLLVRAALEGRKTEQRRDGVYAYPGETFDLEGTTFVVTSVTHERLGDMGEAGAQAEGYEGLAPYRDMILRMHKGMTWEPDHMVWVHRFHAESSVPAT